MHIVKHPGPANSVSLAAFLFSASVLMAEGLAWTQTGQLTIVRIADALQCLGYAMPAGPATLLELPLSLASFALAALLLGIGRSSRRRLPEDVKAHWPARIISAPAS